MSSREELLTIGGLHRGFRWVMGGHRWHPNLLALVQHCLYVDRGRLHRLHKLCLSWLAPLRMQRRLALLFRASLRPLYDEMLIIVIPTQLLLLDMRIRIKCVLSSAHASLLLAAV